MARRSKQTKMDPKLAISSMAELYAKYLALEPEEGIEAKMEALEAKVKQQFPKDFRKMEIAATNLALGHRG